MKKKELPKEYFIEALLDIANRGGPDYDGYNRESAKAMKNLVDTLVSSAKNALDGKPLYYGSYKNGKEKPIWQPQLVTKDWKKVYPTK